MKTWESYLKIIRKIIPGNKHNPIKAKWYYDTDVASIYRKLFNNQ